MRSTIQSTMEKMR